LEIIDEIRLIEPKIKNILSSGYTNSKNTENYKEVGFDFLLSKPYHLKNLKNAIQKLDLGIKF
jgi:CheY-like chemotaxis protein